MHNGADAPYTERQGSVVLGRNQLEGERQWVGGRGRESFNQSQEVRGEV